jgi:hypothetical protein
MLKRVLITATFLTCAGCMSESSTGQSQEPVTAPGILQDTSFIKNWLTKVLTGYVNGDDPKVAYDNLRAALTEDYHNYKLDAIALEYSDMTDEEFSKKWNDRYNTRYVGKGGFFFSTQDSGPVEVTSCVLMESLADTAKIFRVEIRDPHRKTLKTGDFMIVVKGNKLLIDDVKEYD